MLQQGAVDAIVSDLRMPGTDGFRLLRNVREYECHASVAIVILTGEGNESTAVEAMKSGAQDYLVKGRVTRELIQRTVETSIATLAAQRQLVERNEQMERLSEQLAEANIALSQMSRLDSMTKLLNRGAWKEAITLEHDRSVRHDHPYGVIMMDIDHFKLFNDSLGHPAGDDCLCRVATCIGQNTRAIDMVARYGGEEFIILAPETDLHGTKVLAERVRNAIWELDIPHPSSKTADRVTVSVGVAVRSAAPWEDVVKQADEALYAAKHGGRNQVRDAPATHLGREWERAVVRS